MKNKLLFLITLLHSSLFADWSAPRDIAAIEVDRSGDSILYRAAFDGHGNAVIAYICNVANPNRQGLYNDFCLKGSSKWQSTSIDNGRFRSVESLGIVDDRDGNPHLFWTARDFDFNYKFRASFYSVSLLPHNSSPTTIWNSRRESADGFSVKFSENGDCYCKMSASTTEVNYSNWTFKKYSSDAIAILKNGSELWELFEPDSTSYKRQRKYESKRQEFYDIQDKTRSPAHVLDVIYIYANPEGHPLAHHQELYFPHPKARFQYDNQGKLNLCWFERDIGWFSTTAAVKFAGVNAEGEIDEVYSHTVDSNTIFEQGNYLVTPSGNHVAIFNDKKSIVAYTCNEEKEINSSLIRTGNDIESVSVALAQDQGIVVAWKESGKLYTMVVGDSSPTLLSNPNHNIRDLSLVHSQDHHLLVTWEEQYKEEGIENRILRTALYD